jgi:hypothetical protein
MINHEIEIEIAKDGTVKAEIKGAKGKGCLAYAEALQRVVGKITEQELTSEYYEPDEEVRLKPLLYNQEKQ